MGRARLIAVLLAVGSLATPLSAAHAQKHGRHATSRERPVGTKGREADPAIAAGIEKNSRLHKQVTSMLPSRMTLAQATAGFRNQGQFIAALNASKQHDIAFADLKKEITRNGLSLGQAIHKLKPDAGTSRARRR